jgi:nicotinamide phosphoribosyltransferase
MKNDTNTQTRYGDPIPDNLENICLATDAYKQTHWMQYPKGTQKIYSYLEARGGYHSATMFFGLQYIIKKHLEGIRVTQEMINEADDFCRGVFGQNYFNREGWEYILKKYDGRLPIRIKAVPEGTVVPVHNVLMTVENTDPKVPFITNFVETLLMEIWYPINVATNSYYIKKLIEGYCKKAGESLSPFHLNDFGYRGVSSKESAAIGGLAHLVNFLGTDTLAAIEAGMKYYYSDVCGYSVFAAEHSTVTAYGRENEAKAYESFIDNAPDDAILSIVCDSYDTTNAVNNIFGKQLKEKILKRKGKIVLRPDSGYPPDIAREIIWSLWKNFGGTENAAGYKVLNPKVGVIYGDGIDIQMIGSILFKVVDMGEFAPSNIIFGMGGALLQQVNRDTHQFAFKCSAAKINDAWQEIYKQPKTDSTKDSKCGRLTLLKTKDGYETVNDRINSPDSPDDQLVTVFENGYLLKPYTLQEVRDLAANQ